MFVVNKFFDNSEKIDLAWFEEFADRTQYFTTCTAMPVGCQHDVEATDRNGNVFSIELKERDKYYSSWFIEPSKLQHLYNEEARLGRRTFYFNKCGDYIYIFNSTRIKQYNPQKKWAWIYNKGHEKWEYVERYVLPNNLSTIYNIQTNRFFYTK